MRYSKKARALVYQLHATSEVEVIVEELSKSGYRKRSVKSVTKLVKHFKRQEAIKKKRKEARLRWISNNPIKYRARTLVNGAKQRAAKKGIPFDLTEDWVFSILKQGKCQVTGLPFDIKPYSEAGHLDAKRMLAPSLDQREPSAGYTKDNVQIVVFNYNTLKSSGKPEEALTTALALVDVFKGQLFAQEFKAAA
jgi:hypothetical protein